MLHLLTSVQLKTRFSLLQLTAESDGPRSLSIKSVEEVTWSDSLLLVSFALTMKDNIVLFRRDPTISKNTLKLSIFCIPPILSILQFMDVLDESVQAQVTLPELQIKSTKPPVMKNKIHVA